jgi:hypothetical protein
MGFLRFSGVAVALGAAFALSGCPFGPQISVSTTSLHLNYDAVTETYETEETFVISNSGRGELDFDITVDQPWVTITPIAGTGVTKDTPVTVTVAVDRDYSDKEVAFNVATITISSNGGTKTVTATVAPDYFTQAFAPFTFDLENTSLTFTPNGGPSFYEATKTEIDELPTDPAEARAFPLDFNAFGDPVRAGLFGDDTISYYGKEYDELYISSQGWISFGAPGNNPTTVDDHFEVPQISGLPVDATQPGSLVTYLQDDEKVVITYESTDDKLLLTYQYQVELWFNGLVNLSFGDVDLNFSGLVGFSNGQGRNGFAPSDFVPSDFSSYNTAPLGS